MAACLVQMGMSAFQPQGLGLEPSSVKITQLFILTKLLNRIPASARCLLAVEVVSSLPEGNHKFNR